MSGNLCRCGAYNGIVDAITEVYAEVQNESLHLRTSEHERGGIAPRRQPQGAKYLGGGTNLVDLMRETTRAPCVAGGRDRPVDGH